MRPLQQSARQRARYPMKRLLKSKYIIFLLAALTLSACSSDRDNFISRNYHTFVGFFNGYYHAKEAYNQGVREINESFETEKGELLPLVPEGGAGGSKFNRAISKCDVLITRHKNGRYVDDAYLLKGKCNYFMGDYFEALKNFRYILLEFEDTDVTAEIYLWMARTYYFSGNVYRAEELLNKVEQEFEPDKRLNIPLAEMRVTVELRKENYNEALRLMELKLPDVKKKWRKAKWNFLMAQLYQRLDAFDDAIARYERAYRYNVSNDLNFKCKLAVAEMYSKSSASSGQSLEEIQKPLVKLLKDAKYDEFQDEIYYNLARIEHDHDNLEQALEYYRQSVAKNAGKEQMRVYSYYYMGRIFFYNLQEFDSAQVYFDNAATLVTEDFEDYRTIRELSKTLGKYKEYKDDMRQSDSLLVLAGKDETAQKKHIAEQVQAEEKAKEEAKRREEQAQMAGRNKMMQEQFQQQQQNQNLSQQRNLFYFENPTQVSQGKTTFIKVWGARKNEDHWRRKNKQAVEGGGGLTAVGGIPIADDPNDPKYGVEARKKLYFKNIPRGDSALTALNESLKEAIYGLASLYHQKLSMPDSAIKYYNMLIKRFPTSKEVPRAYYAMYTLSRDINKKSEAERYKKIILDRYPNTIYAQLVRKGKADGAMTTEEDFEAAYQSLYNLFSAGDYETSLTFSDFIIGKHIDNTQIPKVYYVKGASYGHAGQQDSLIKYYKFIISSFPEAGVSDVARRTLDFMNVDYSKAGTESGAPETDDPDETNDEDAEPLKLDVKFEERKSGESLTYILMAKKKGVKKDDLAVAVDNFNKQNYPDKGLKTQVYVYRDDQLDDHWLVYITSFKTGSVADAYANKIMNDEGLKTQFGASLEYGFYITSGNFRTAFTKKRFKAYDQYFEANRDDIKKD